MLEQETPSLVLPAVELPALELPTEDGIPLDSPWHRDAINLLIELVRCFWRGRADFYTGGNMFVYFSFEQAQAVKREIEADVVPPPDKRAYRGPDFFVIKDVDGTRYRDTWVVWEEGGRYPDLIIELLSPSTAETDKTDKKDLYERTFRTPEYYWYDPASQELVGWRLQAGRYERMTPNAEGRLWSEVLGLWLGTWEGEFQGERAVWLRFFDADGQLVLTGEEAAQAEAEAERQRAEDAEQRAEAERQRAETAEAELARLRADLGHQDT
ncbi:MAG: Uma2 family endonuclease [Anaerolineae bacterium]